VTETRGGYRYLIFEGRKDSQIKVRGQKVDMSEVEMIISTIHLVSKVKVLCLNPGEQNQVCQYLNKKSLNLSPELLMQSILISQMIVAFVVPKEKDCLYRIKDMMEKKLLPYQIPVLHEIPEVPLLVNGKTDRQRLLREYETFVENRKFLISRLSF